MFSVPDLSAALARLRRGVKLAPERGGGTRGALINVGVIDEARGRGVALAMAARSFLAMAQRKMQFAGYTLVLDDNWAVAPHRGEPRRARQRQLHRRDLYRRRFATAIQMMRLDAVQILRLSSCCSFTSSP